MRVHRRPSLCRQVSAPPSLWSRSSFGAPSGGAPLSHQASSRRHASHRGRDRPTGLQALRGRYRRRKCCISFSAGRGIRREDHGHRRKSGTAIT
ncbi:hypothetical protein NDU88_004526 [Pleurodeles waltl]|uniref:Uncharacterized protein n=1 Tax=Pleurodeles waltl TaxID=8319 RepID=A0AAV7WUX6_PLEWA|nr:hypothetical protein NDU88_004526 [Pleurodeles waltl]